MSLGMRTYNFVGRTVILDNICFVNEPKEVASGKQSGFGQMSNLIFYLSVVWNIILEYFRYVTYFPVYFHKIL